MVRKEEGMEKQQPTRPGPATSRCIEVFTINDSSTLCNSKTMVSV